MSNNGPESQTILVGGGIAGITVIAAQPQSVVILKPASPYSASLIFPPIRLDRNGPVAAVGSEIISVAHE